MKKIIYCLVLSVLSVYAFGQDSAVLVVIKPDLKVDFPKKPDYQFDKFEKTEEPINPVIIGSFYGKNCYSITKTLDSLSFKFKNQKKPNDDLLIDSYEKDNGDYLTLGINKADSSIISLQFQTKNSALPYLQYFQSLEYEFKDETIGDNPAYLYADDEIEVLILEKFDAELTILSISQFSTFDIVKEKYNDSPLAKRENGRWKAFIEIRSLENKDNKTIEEVLAVEAKVLEPFTLNDFAKETNKSAFKKLNQLIEKHFLKDAAFLKNVQDRFSRIMQPLMADENPKTVKDNYVSAEATTRTMENYLTFHNLKCFGYFVFYCMQIKQK